MAVNTESSIAFQTAMSYFEDINQEIDKLDRYDVYVERERYGQPIIDGDLELAYSEIMKSEPHEQPILMGMYHCCLGRIKASIYVLQDKYARICSDNSVGRNAKKNMAEAAEAFSRAIAANPLPSYQYYLACTYLDLERKSEAVQMFELVANGDNSKLALEARKTIGRIGPVAPIKSASSSSNSDGGGFVRSQRAQWDEIIKGSIALFFGIALSGIIIGIPLAIWGVWLIAKGFMQKIDT
jgi:tetratricopeptide (TPR) repeat protein